MHPEFCMVSDFPEVLTVDERNRPHNSTGPSHRWADGWELHHWHGVRVPAFVIEQPESITAATINAETNQEVRRVMVERYGFDRYIADSGAKPLGADDVGELYEIDERRVVRVLNSTPEPDGSVKTYTLKGSMRATTARESVASTFGLKAIDYQPVIET